jgi:ribulose-phosphate 3-epimerase
MIDSAGLSTELEVDGGIKATNVGAVISAGADVIVAGSAVYNDSITIAEAVTEMKVNMSASLNGRVS